ncbi:MAG: hypothetical protein D6682_08185 [Zetaproteobacteria bacterium]|nr:MAG: hypothetical protein D6682_08185 [Zetaproteobacteria bacterium]
MSYILEALQRADRERKRVEPPSIAQVVAPGGPPAPHPRRVLWPALLWLAGALLLFAAVWLLVRGHAGPATASVGQQAPQATLTPGHQAAADSTVSAPTAPATPIARRPEVAARMEAAKSGAGPESPTARPSVSQPLAAPKPPVRPPAAHPAEAVPAPAPRAKGASAPQPSSSAQPGVGDAAAGVVPWGALPPGLRARLPAIHIAALIDHADPARRLALINGRTLHAGEWLAEGLRLVAIGAGRVTLDFHGYRFTMTPFDEPTRGRRGD